MKLTPYERKSVTRYVIDNFVDSDETFIINKVDKNFYDLYPDACFYNVSGVIFNRRHSNPFELKIYHDDIF